jgi:hypothetical protein
VVFPPVIERDGAGVEHERLAAKPVDRLRRDFRGDPLGERLRRVRADHVLAVDRMLPQAAADDAIRLATAIECEIDPVRLDRFLVGRAQ